MSKILQSLAGGGYPEAADESRTRDERERHCCTGEEADEGEKILPQVTVRAIL